jgi:hypothetical protein
VHKSQQARALAYGVAATSILAVLGQGSRRNVVVLPRNGPHVLVGTITSTEKIELVEVFSSVAFTLRLFHSSIVPPVNALQPGIGLKPAHRFAAAGDGWNDPVPTEFDYSS